MAEKNDDELIDRVPASGNMSVLKITEEKGMGLIIHWFNENYQLSMISCVGKEKPLYDHIKSLYPNLRDATGSRLAVISDENGFVKSIGVANGPMVEVGESKK